MQKSISFILVLSMVFAVGASIASALPLRVDERQKILRERGTTTNQNMGGQRMMIDGGTTTGTSTMGERRAERMEKLSGQRKEIIKRYAEMMFKRIEAAVERLKKLGNRIEKRITILKGKGMNTAKAESLLASARIEITNTETHLGMAKTAAQGAIESGTPKEAFAAVRTHVEEARDAAKKAHRALVDSVVALKGKSGGKTATTTATTTAQQ